MKEASLSIVEDVENGRYLMIRNHRGINKGCLNFPGGKKEPGEDMRACVIRETFEETGITLSSLFIFSASNHSILFILPRLYFISLSVFL